MTDRPIPAELKMSGSQRQAILYIEVLGLIHDLGKITDGFLRSVSEDYHGRNNYNYNLFVDPGKLYSRDTTCATIQTWKNIANESSCAFQDIPDLTNTLMSIKIKSWEGTKYSLGELVPFLSWTKEWKKIVAGLMS